jgi:L-seryl-tRNA(Ser) seleniumtransferase
MLRAIPSVDAAVRALEGRPDVADCPRPILVRTVRDALEAVREAAVSGSLGDTPDAVQRAAAEAVERAAARARRLTLVPVLNGTGVIVHTNLGRAPLPAQAIAAVAEASAGYSNLEFDLGDGRRGARDLIVRDALCELTGAEDALVVNNNAAAVMLSLDTLARGRDVLVSRGELIEVGGAFRLPDVFEKSGATLVEVGTTNRTRIEDFERAVRARTAALMSAHWSNYSIVGFVDRVPLADLVGLGARYGIPVIHDMGSGLVVPGREVGLPEEMSAQDSLRAGVTVCTMSGDKLLGGPQAGIVLGKAAVVARMRANPLARALRPCKLTFAALQATLALYLTGRAAESVPVIRMLRADAESLDRRARVIARRVGERRDAGVEVVTLTSRIGGGAAPERTLESSGLALHARDLTAEDIAARLLACATPLVTRINDGRVLVDLRTVPAEDDDALVSSITEALKSHGN